MRKLVAMYDDATRGQRLALASVLVLLGLVLLVTKAMAGTPANSQSVTGFVAGLTGLYMIWQEME